MGLENTYMIISYPRGKNRSNKNVTFKISENIHDSNNLQVSKIPHFRKGYFRLLKSDY